MACTLSTMGGGHVAITHCTMGGMLVQMLTSLSLIKVKLTGAQKALAKTDKTGMKSLSSFFCVKPKGPV